jgi:hypothetical protein
VQVEAVVLDGTLMREATIIAIIVALARNTRRHAPRCLSLAFAVYVAAHRDPCRLSSR